MTEKSHDAAASARSMFWSRKSWLGLAFAAGAMGALALLGGHADGLSRVVTLLIVFVAAIVMGFSSRYMRADRSLAGFRARIALLVFSVLAFVLAKDLLTFWLAWVASGWLLSALIGHVQSWSDARLAARRARTAFMIGDGGLLVAFVLLWEHSGSLEITVNAGAISTLPAALSMLIAGLLLVAALARCASPPFSGWLLSSMTAPTPVSALMHAGLVNAGGFLLIRFSDVLEAAPAVRGATVALGAFAALYGVAIMIVRPDIKRALAGSTISQMGFMIMSCGLGAYAAALWHLVAHGLFKAWLFLGTGSAIGVPRHSQTTSAGRAMTLAIAVGAFGVAAGLTAIGRGGTGVVPLVLAVATALAMFANILNVPASVPNRLRLTLLAVAAIAFHGIGYAVTEGILNVEGPPLLSGFAELLLVAAFLAAWVWQQHRVVQGSSIHPRLYVRLINAGAPSTR